MTEIRCDCFKRPHRQQSTPKTNECMFCRFAKNTNNRTHYELCERDRTLSFTLADEDITAVWSTRANSIANVWFCRKLNGFVCSNEARHRRNALHAPHSRRKKQNRIKRTTHWAPADGNLHSAIYQIDGHLVGRIAASVAQDENNKTQRREGADRRILLFLD